MTDDSRPLSADFYDRPVTEVAKELLGKVLFRSGRTGMTTGRIVEVEAYLSQGDSACHAARGKTAGNQTMFGPPGRAYVYSIHSRYCVNAVTEADGTPSAVLIRAVDPRLGRKLMVERRGREKDRELACGPGRLCEAFDIDRSLDGWDLSSGEELWIGKGRLSEDEAIFATPRIGVTSAADLPFRFCIMGNQFVSGTRALRGL